MLKKLYKYDWKSVSSILIILHIVLLVYTLIGRIVISFFLSGPGQHVDGKTAELLEVASALYIIAYVMFIFGIVITTMLFISIKIQKSLFSDEGYLTHTLPVSPAKLLTSKVLVYWTWAIIDILCVLLSLFILCAYKETMPSILHVFSETFKTLTGFYSGETQLEAWLVILSVMIDDFFYFTGLILFALCLGSLFKNHKVLGAIVSFFGINIIQSVISTIFILVLPGLSPFSVTEKMTSDGMMYSTNLAPSGSLIFTIIWHIILSILFFLGSHYIVSKKLNLD